MLLVPKNNDKNKEVISTYMYIHVHGLDHIMCVLVL